MQKTVLITGSTDGIGLAAAKMVAAKGHLVLLHGRNRAKLEEAARVVSAVPGCGPVETFEADLSRLGAVEALAQEVAAKHDRLDVLVNNAGVYRVSERVTSDGLDVRFAVNTVAPYLLTLRLLPLMGPEGRVVNLSSAAQAPVDLQALAGAVKLEDMAAYAQSKLAIAAWSYHLAQTLPDGPMVVALNPGSMLGTKMVKEGFGVAGGDIGIGADIITRAALSDEFVGASGKYFDNDAGRFGPPHRDAVDAAKAGAIVRAIEGVLARVKG